MPKKAEVLNSFTKTKIQVLFGNKAVFKNRRADAQCASCLEHGSFATESYFENFYLSSTFSNLVGKLNNPTT